MGLFDSFKSTKPQRSEAQKYMDERAKKEHIENFFEEDNKIKERFSYNGICSFLIEDVFVISGRGLVVTGKVQNGTFSLNDKVQVDRLNGMQNIETVITGIEQFRKQCVTVQEGENAGILLRGLSRNDVHPGDVLIK